MPNLYLEFENDEIVLMSHKYKALEDLEEDELEQLEQQIQREEIEETDDIEAPVDFSEHEREFREDKEGNVVIHRADECVAFIPIALYRNPLHDSMPVEIDFEPTGHLAHMVLVRYIEQFPDGANTVRAKIVKLCKTRREALEIKEEVENCTYECIPGEENPWEADNCMTDEIENAIEIITLDIED